MILRTGRLVLRPLEAGDAAALFAILGDDAAMAFWDRPALPRLGTVEALLADELAAMAAGACLYWTVMQGEDAIGSIDLSHIRDGGAWTGFLLRRDRWGRGLGREAVAAVAAQAFGPLALTQLWARVQLGNRRAVGLLRGLGFAQRQVLPAYVRREDGDRDCAVFALTRR